MGAQSALSAGAADRRIASQSRLSPRRSRSQHPTSGSPHTARLDPPKAGRVFLRLGPLQFYVAWGASRPQQLVQCLRYRRDRDAALNYSFLDLRNGCISDLCWRGCGFRSGVIRQPLCAQMYRGAKAMCERVDHRAREGRVCASRGGLQGSMSRSKAWPNAVLQRVGLRPSCCPNGRETHGSPDSIRVRFQFNPQVSRWHNATGLSSNNKVTMPRYGQHTPSRDDRSGALRFVQTSPAAERWRGFLAVPTFPGECCKRDERQCGASDAEGDEEELLSVHTSIWAITSPVTQAGVLRLARRGAAVVGDLGFENRRHPQRVGDLSNPAGTGARPAAQLKADETNLFDCTQFVLEPVAAQAGAIRRIEAPRTESSNSCRKWQGADRRRRSHFLAEEQRRIFGTHYPARAGVPQAAWPGKSLPPKIRELRRA